MAVNEPSSTDNFVQIEDRVINKVADATDTTDNITLDDRVFIFKENESKQIEKVCNAKVSWLVDKFAEEATKAKNDAITAKNDAISAKDEAIGIKNDMQNSVDSINSDIRELESNIASMQSNINEISSYTQAEVDAIRIATIGV